MVWVPHAEHCSPYLYALELVLQNVSFTVSSDYPASFPVVHLVEELPSVDSYLAYE